MDVKLTEGAILKITAQHIDHDDGCQPTLQVLDLKQIQSQSERYRLALSDGSAILQGLISSQLNILVHQGLLQKGSVVKLTRFTCTTVQNRKIIVIVSLDVVADKCDIIGQPINTMSPAIVPGNAQSLNSSARGAGHEAVDVTLTERAILKIITMQDRDANEHYQPTLQVLDLKQIQSRHGGGQETGRYRLVLSDGSAIQHGILSTQLIDLNILVHQGLQKGSVVKLTKFTCITILNRKIIVILSLEVVAGKCDIIATSPAIVPGEEEELCNEFGMCKLV